MALATISGAALKDALKPQLTLLVDDMRAKLTADPAELERWRATHRNAVAEQRTAVSWTDWSEDQLTQAAVGWLLTSVFVRFCEDNLLLGDTAVWITHPDPMLRQRAIDAEQAFYRSDTNHSYREWLEESFGALRKFPATQSLVDEHAALNIIAPSSDAVHQVLSFWRQVNDAGELVWTFRDPELSTRFLGDLYQDLSDFAKKKYALLQTPEFVEEFILDQTLEPALKDRPLEGFKVIDPTCGSGHFLLGAFARLVDRWHREAPGLDLRTRVDNALSSVYGVDLNPFAVAIAKFRLIVAALKACGETTFVNAPKFTVNLANGDSLLHGPVESDGKVALDYGSDATNKDLAVTGFAYSTEDVAALRRILTPREYDVVVGNPPYIVVSDKALNARYREIYHYCKGKYALTAPFMERFFQLAKSGSRAGWVGQITSNSFMKREFGVPLVKEYLARLDLRLVADTSGAYIPGHGTPTVILVGRNHTKVHETVRAVLGIQGEPGAPDDPAKGKVWTSILKHVGNPGYEDQWISVAELPRENLSEHPWSLSGGGAVELQSAIETSSRTRLETPIAGKIGFASFPGADDAFFGPASSLRRSGITEDHIKTVILGEAVRDWDVQPIESSFAPYTSEFEEIELDTGAQWYVRQWPLRRFLGGITGFNGETQADSGAKWWTWYRWVRTRYTNPLSITFAFVATHNHFVLDRGGKVFKQSAPVIKLPEGATEDDHLRLLGTLNSSTACFWLKQNSQKKGGGGHGGGAADQPWSHTYEFTGTTLQEFPLPKSDTLARARHLDNLAQQLSTMEPAAAIESEGATAAVIESAQIEYARIRALMVAEQDELDWEVYRNYGLIDDELYLPVGEVPGIAPSERAFAITLARKVAAGEVETSWFDHHNHKFAPVTEIPAHWPTEYRELVEKRLQVIESNPFIGLLERPEYKRRWAGDSWDVKLQRALKDWLLDRLEDRSLWFTPQGTPQMLSVAELAGRVEKDPEFITALDLWAGKKDAPVTETLVKLLADEAVPYLAAMRYKESGLRKRAEWERVWDLQRDEDAGLVKASDIPVPPKYTSGDFLKSSFWSHRGKLDVPKERFISYPGAGRATDPTPLLGWAGWNHAQQGIALATIYALREQEGTALTELVPVVAGIAEVLPWVKQWHSGVDPTFGIDLADYLTGQLNEKAAAIGVPVPDLGNWRPPKATRGRKARA